MKVCIIFIAFDSPSVCAYPTT